MQPVLIATGEKAIDPGESDITMISLKMVQKGSKFVDGCKKKDNVFESSKVVEYVFSNIYLGFIFLFLCET